MNYTELVAHLRKDHKAPAFVFDNIPEVVREAHAIDHEKRQLPHKHEESA